MKECAWWKLNELLNFVTVAYWLCFLAAWIYQIFIAEIVPCGRLHVAVAGAIVVRLVARFMAMPALSMCRADRVLDDLAYMSEEVSWGVSFSVGLIICRGYGITHWRVSNKTVWRIGLVCSGLILCAVVPVAANSYTPYSMVAFLYALLIYISELYLGVRTLRTLGEIKQYVKESGQIALEHPVKARQCTLIIILTFLLAEFLFLFSVFVFSHISSLSHRAPHLHEIWDTVNICSEPVINTAIYYEVRPKVQDYDLKYTVDPDRPFHFVPPDEAPLYPGQQFLV